MTPLTIILDSAHGVDTPGKRSPDGSHREYLWSRDIVNKLRNKLQAQGYTVFLTAPEDTEPGLSERVRRANAFPGTRKLLISLHNNAAGDGSKWMNASGVEIFTTPGQTKSDQCAEILMNTFRALFPGLRYRTDNTDVDQDKEARFTVLTGNYMAVLIEWLFQDNQSDVSYLKNTTYNEELVNALAIAISKIHQTP